MAITATEYARFAKTDTATFIGMRLALAQAVVDVDARKAKGENVSHPNIAKSALLSAIEKEPYLQAAGTRELVKRYFDHFDAKGIKGFYDSATGKLDAKLLTSVRDGTAGWLDLLSIGKAYNSSALANLGIESLTKDFQAKIRAEGTSITKDLTITPSAMTDLQVAALENMEGKFRKADKADEYLGTPPVAHLFASVNKDREKQYRLIQEPLNRLLNATSPDPAADAKLITETVTGVKYDKVPTTAYEGKKFAQLVQDNIVKGRSEAPFFDAGEISVTYEKKRRFDGQTQEEQEKVDPVLGRLRPPSIPVQTPPSPTIPPKAANER